jgi:hypothetical protein
MPQTMPQNTITFYDNRGRLETADMHAVMFSDGIQRLICTHAHVPAAYLPKDVYHVNDETNEYTKVGTYTTTETKSTQWYNARTNAWEGTPGETLYHFDKAK